MGRHDDNEPLLPPRIRAAFDFLNYAQRVTEQCDASIPVRDLFRDHVYPECEIQQYKDNNRWRETIAKLP